jgi:putative acyl-CoA dehydrogenase
MCDAFLVLAQAPGGLSCFLVPRFRPDDTPNPFLIQRLKDKLGNRSNASSEIEFHDTHAVLISEEGRGVRTIIDMVNHTRLDCVIGSAAMIRQAAAQAIHHARHRVAFGKKLVDQDLMRNVLADLALESEAAAALAIRLSLAFERRDSSEHEAAFSRIATAIAKFWVCKRAPWSVYESMECLGGGGYVEESILPRLYREAPVNAIWEGSGNVICLDVKRALAREPHTRDALYSELGRARGNHARYDQAFDNLDACLSPEGLGDGQLRNSVSRLAAMLQASLLIQEAPGFVADAYCESRLGAAPQPVFGMLAPAIEPLVIIDRALAS